MALTGGLVGPALAADVVDMFRPDDDTRRQGISHLVLALDPARTSPTEPAADRLTRLAESVRAAGGRVPGTNRRDPRDVPDDTELAVDPGVLDDLTGWAHHLGVA